MSARLPANAPARTLAKAERPERGVSLTLVPLVLTIHPAAVAKGAMLRADA